MFFKFHTFLTFSPYVTNIRTHDICVTTFSLAYRKVYFATYFCTSLWPCVRVWAHNQQRFPIYKVRFLVLNKKLSHSFFFWIKYFYKKLKKERIRKSKYLFYWKSVIKCRLAMTGLEWVSYCFSSIILGINQSNLVFYCQHRHRHHQQAVNSTCRCYAAISTFYACFQDHESAQLSKCFEVMLL